MGPWPSPPLFDHEYLGGRSSPSVCDVYYHIAFLQSSRYGHFMQTGVKLGGQVGDFASDEVVDFDCAIKGPVCIEQDFDCTVGGCDALQQSSVLQIGLCNAGQAGEVDILDGVFEVAETLAVAHAEETDFGLGFFVVDLECVRAWRKVLDKAGLVGFAQEGRKALPGPLALGACSVGDTRGVVVEGNEESVVGRLGAVDVSVDVIVLLFLDIESEAEGLIGIGRTGLVGVEGTEMRLGVRGRVGFEREVCAIEIGRASCRERV